MSVDLDEHRAYVADTVRLRCFKAAIDKVVRPGDRVADLGCGSGILGLLCLQAGAGSVHFIDDSAMIDIARQTIALSGLSDRATFIHGRSQQVVLPEPVDVVVCDHVGFIGFDYGIAELLLDASRRFLKPGGILIPTSIDLGIAAIESESCRKLADGWCTQDIPPEFHWLREYSVNAKHAVEFKPEELLTKPAPLGRIDLCAGRPEFFSWTTGLRIERDGMVHGLGAWFDCELAPGVWMSNSPLAEAPIRRLQVFLPVGEAVGVRSGEQVKATLMARPGDNLIAWTVEFPGTGRRYSYSTWSGMPLSREGLLRSDPSRVPQVNRVGRARALVLAFCDGRRTQGEIEQAVLREHPNLFPSKGEILRFVAQVLHQDTH